MQLHSTEETKQVLRLSLTEFSLPKFYLLFGISKVKSAAVIAFRSSYRDRSFSPGSYERETFALTSLETVTEALLEIMEVCGDRRGTPGQGRDPGGQGRGPGDRRVILGNSLGDRAMTLGIAGTLGTGQGPWTGRSAGVVPPPC